MIPATYLEIWRAMSLAEKRAERVRWVKDLAGGIGLIAFMAAALYGMDIAAGFCSAIGWCA